MKMDQNLVAPCGMNCNLCIGHLREKNRCNGCSSGKSLLRKSCSNCYFRKCDYQKGFCYQCEKFPCTRLKKLDLRYKTNYKMSMIDNLHFIKKEGLDSFLKQEEQKYTCPNCGNILSVHRDFCIFCKKKINA